VGSPQVIGRYALYGKLASGGMATVHLGRLIGPVGFSRTVAIKRMHAQFTENPDFVSMFIDEARLAARVRHPNVVPTVDVVATEGELFLVMEYVHGESLAKLLVRAGALDQRMPVPVVAAVLSGVLRGLHAAHEATNERGEPLGIVHRDVSPQNVIVGVDGVPRVLDFGVAKAAGRLHTTRDGSLKGKLAYMAPEQVRGESLTRRCDIYAASVVLWESLTGRRLFGGDNEAAVLQNVLAGQVEPPSAFAPEVPEALDAVVLRGLARDPAERFPTAREMAIEIEAAASVAIAPVVSAWVEQTAAEALAKQATWIAQIESASHAPGPSPQLPSGTKAVAGAAAEAPAAAHTQPMDNPALVDTVLGTQADSIFVSTRRRASRLTRASRAAILAGGLAALAIGALAFSGLRLGARSAGQAAPNATPVPSADLAAPVEDLTAEAPLVEPGAPSAAAAASASAPKAAPPGPLQNKHALAPPVRTAPAASAPPRASAAAPAYNPLDHL
jgi:eukaryotic-like serine/threonine-protein kinase